VKYKLLGKRSQLIIASGTSNKSSWKVRHVIQGALIENRDATAVR
jgi:hypothetical protein